MPNRDSHENSVRGLSRRKFLSHSAAAATVLAAPRIASRAKGQPARGANETISVGLIGGGSRGHYLGYLFESEPDVRVAAVCDVFDEHTEKAAELVTRVGGKPVLHSDYRRVLDDPEIDAVVIATNVHWHAIPAIAACAAGKDVYLEKPVGCSVVEGRAVIDAARENGRIVAMGMQQQTWPHYHQAAEIIRSGEIGDVSEVHVWDVRNMPLGAPADADPPSGLDWDFWLGPAPKVAYNANRQFHHDWFFDYSGGWQLVWGVHHLGAVHSIMGVQAPTSVSASGGKYAFAKENREWPDTFNGACEYPPGPAAARGFHLRYTCRTGSGRPVEGCHHGKAFHGTKGTLVLSRQGYSIYPDAIDGTPAPAPERMVKSELKEHEVVIRHVQGFLESVRSRKAPVVDVEAGHAASNPGHLMNIAWRLGRKVTWDARLEKCPGDSQANALLTRQYRSPWTLPA
jgi:predicted dehydrogenase